MTREEGRPPWVYKDALATGHCVWLSRNSKSLPTFHSQLSYTTLLYLVLACTISNIPATLHHVGASCCPYHVGPGREHASAGPSQCHVGPCQRHRHLRPPSRLRQG